MWIQTSAANKQKNDKDKYEPRLITWDDCDTVQVNGYLKLQFISKAYLTKTFFFILKDFITIYDGYTTRDPVILKFCGGGGNGLAAATSSGPELLIEFVTSPFGTLSSSPVQSRTLNGFHLEVFYYIFLFNLFL